MNRLRNPTLLALTISAFLGACALTLTGCAHSYYYLPEIKGDNVKLGKEGSIDYSVPSENPFLRMRVHSLGYETVKDRKMLVIRMAFLRTKHTTAEVSAKTSIFLKPEEQLLQFGPNHGPEVKPAYIYTNARNDKVIELTGREHAVAEYLFPLPLEKQGTKDLEQVTFHWKVHYGTKDQLADSTRFDRYDAAPAQGAEPYPDDPAYPFDISPLINPERTYTTEPLWWPFFW